MGASGRLSDLFRLPLRRGLALAPLGSRDDL